MASTLWSANRDRRYEACAPRHTCRGKWSARPISTAMDRGNRLRNTALSGFQTLSLPTGRLIATATGRRSAAGADVGGQRAVGIRAFHYGRWAFISGQLGLVSRGYIARPVWAPALVAGTAARAWGLSVAGGRPLYGWVPLGWREPYYPGWRRCSSNCWARFNRPYGIDVNERPSALPVHHVNLAVPGALSAVPATSLVSRRPVRSNLVSVPGDLASSAPVMRTIPQMGTEQRPVPRAPAAMNSLPPAASTYARVCLIRRLRAHGRSNVPRGRLAWDLRGSRVSGTAALQDGATRVEPPPPQPRHRGRHGRSAGVRAAPDLPAGDPASTAAPRRYRREHGTLAVMAPPAGCWALVAHRLHRLLGAARASPSAPAASGSSRSGGRGSERSVPQLPATGTAVTVTARIARRSQPAPNWRRVPAMPAVDEFRARLRARPADWYTGSSVYCRRPCGRDEPVCRILVFPDGCDVRATRGAGYVAPAVLLRSDGRGRRPAPAGDRAQARALAFFLDESNDMTCPQSLQAARLPRTPRKRDRREDRNRMLQ
jgi:hypothetical protein